MSILWGHWLLLFWTSCVLPHGFQIQSGSLTCTLSCLCAVILKVTTGATPAFSTNRSVHCIKCIQHGWPGSSHMHRDLNHQYSGELLSGAWLSQTRYRLSYSAGLRIGKGYNEVGTRLTAILGLGWCSRWARRETPLCYHPDMPVCGTLSLLHFLKNKHKYQYVR